MQKEAVCQPKFREGKKSCKVNLGQFFATLNGDGFGESSFLCCFAAKQAFVEAFVCVDVSGETDNIVGENVAVQAYTR